MTAAAIARADHRAASRSVIRNTERIVVPTNLAALARSRLSIVKMDEASVLVADRYLFFPATGFWRSTCGSLKGYGAGTLLADAAIGEELRRNITLLPEIEEPLAAAEPLMITPPLNNEDDPDSQAEAAASVPTATKLALPSL